MSSAYSAVLADLQALKNPAKARILQRFFKTGPGEYGEGDVFFGITVPQQREVGKKHYKEMELEETRKLLESPIHECRLTALLILVEKFAHAKRESEKKAIYALYLQEAHAGHINNWDLVDLSAPSIVGQYLREQGDWKTTLPPLARSRSLWERRIAIVSTFQFIYEGEFAPTQQIAIMLRDDEQDLIHKATGWMLREMGKRGGEKELRAFLEQNGARMPRTMLRYAIERMSPSERAEYLAMGARRAAGRVGADRVKKPANNHPSRPKRRA